MKDIFAYGRPGSPRVSLQACGLSLPGQPPASQAPAVIAWLREALHPELWEAVVEGIVTECIEPMEVPR